jgi:hypothetical protein
MRAAVRLVAVHFEVSQENRPKRVSASIDRGSRKMCSQHAITLLLNLDDLLFYRRRLAVPHGQRVWHSEAFSYNCRLSNRRILCPIVAPGSPAR